VGSRSCVNGVECLALPVLEPQPLGRVTRVQSSYCGASCEECTFTKVIIMLQDVQHANFETEKRKPFHLPQIAGTRFQ
jgi:hypothetical protein